MEIVFLIWLCLLLGGPYWAYKGYVDLKRKRRLVDTPTSNTSSAAKGNVELQGYAWPAQDLIAPFTNEKVCFYLMVGTNTTSKKVEEVFRTTLGNKFFLADSTGTVLVEPDTDMIFELTNKSYGNWLDLNIEYKELVYTALKKQNINPYNFNPTDLKIDISYLKPQSRLYVNGSLQPMTEKNRSIVPMAGLEQFMVENRRQFVRSYIVNDKKITEVDSPWVKKTDGKTATELITSTPSENPWNNCYGVVSGQSEKQLFLFDEWETETKNSFENYLVAIIGGALLFTLALLPFLISVAF